MATVSGRLLFDRAREANPPGSMTGIANVAIVLYSTSTNESLAVLTDPNGNYSFTNVPNGDYLIVEAFGTVPAVPTPGNFDYPAPSDMPKAVVPPISYATNPPLGATNLDCVSRNTIPITVADNVNITNRFILNGPVTYSPIQSIMDSCAGISPINVITDASSGTMGAFPPGMPINTSVPAEPFPLNVPDYDYVLTRPDLFVPDADEYTVQNVLTDTNSTRLGAWWRVADHSVGNETGLMMVVNGDVPGSVFFTTTVNVTPSTYYLFSAWILNLFKVNGWADPKLGVAILDQSGTEIFNQNIGVLIPVNLNNPEWKQIGTAIYSADNTSLTVQFLSEGPEAIGNDYAIDDISFQEITIPTFKPVKSASADTAIVGDTVTYTVTLTNTCQSPLVNVRFMDKVPDGLIFVPNSVKVNEASIISADPNEGFDIPNIPGGGTVEIMFDVVVGGIPNPNPAVNHADMHYSYTPVQGGILGDFNVTSNDVELLVAHDTGNADLSVTKSVSPMYALHGNLVTYTLVVNNIGPDTAENAILSDEISPIILDPEFSLDGGDSFSPWPGSHSLGNMTPNTTQIIIIRGEVDPTAAGFYTNTAKIVSSTPDPDLENNTDSATIEVISAADIAVVKSASHTSIVPGEELTYTIYISNLGPDMAEDVELTDIIPSEMPAPKFSIDGGIIFQTWPGWYNIGNLPANGTQTVIIKGMIDENAVFSTIENQAAVSSITPDPDLSNNTSSADTGIRPLADIAIEKTASYRTRHPGDMLIYTLKVTNAGPNPSINVLVADNIPPGTLVNPQFSVDGMPWGAWPGSYVLDIVPPMGERIITITCTVDASAAGTIINTSTALGETPDPDLVNNLSTIDVEVEPLADVLIEKTALPDLVRPGDSLSYTLYVANLGPSAAENVVVTDDLPAGIENPQFSVDGGPTAPWEGNYTIGTLAPGDSRTITITGTIAYDFISNTNQG